MPGPDRSQRLGQDDAAAADARPAPAARRHGAPGRHGADQLAGRAIGRRGRLPAARRGVVCRHGGTQHRAARADRLAGGHRSGATGRRARDDRAPAAGLRHRVGRRRRRVVGRPAATHRAGASRVRHSEAGRARRAERESRRRRRGSAWRRTGGVEAHGNDGGAGVAPAHADAPRRQAGRAARRRARHRRPAR